MRPRKAFFLRMYALVAWFPCNLMAMFKVHLDQAVRSAFLEQLHSLASLFWSSRLIQPARHFSRCVTCESAPFRSALSTACCTLCADHDAPISSSEGACLRQQQPFAVGPGVHAVSVIFLLGPHILPVRVRMLSEALNTPVSSPLW